MSHFPRRESLPCRMRWQFYILGVIMSENFKKTILTYVKHKGLELELTLQDGNVVKMIGPRKVENEAIVQTYGDGRSVMVPLAHIRRAEVFAN